MSRSIAARYTARPVARFVRSPARAGERMLGLVRPGSVRPAPRLPAFLDGPESAPVAALRRPGASPAAERRSARRARLEATPRIHWTRQDGRIQASRTGVVSASWRA